MKMKHDFPQIGRFFRLLFAVLTTAATIGGVALNAHATVVQTTNKTINNGRADFGSGNHSFGGPSGNATITYDWSVVGGQIVSTGRVRGTLYVDSAFSSTCARLTIRWRNTGNTNLNSISRTICGPGGDANNSANRLPIDESFQSVILSNITLATAEVVNNTEVAASTPLVIGQVTQRDYTVKVNNGVADFGDGSHSFGSPNDPGHIVFHRNIAAGTMSSIVDGILYYDAFNDDSCSRLVLDRRTGAGTILNHQSMLNCGPGGNANDGANELFVTGNTFTGGSVSDLRMEVSDTAFPADGVTMTFGFAGQVGDFEVDPSDALVQANQPYIYPVMWSVPEPLNWHDLRTVELRIREDGGNTILDVKFEEGGNLFSVFNDATGRFGNAYPVGSNRKLQTRYVSLDLGETSVGPVNGAIGAGPTSPTVRLGLALTFKPPAAGKTYSVEVAATDDLGHEDTFAVAGSLTVN